MPIAYLITNLVLLLHWEIRRCRCLNPMDMNYSRIPKRTVWWLAHCLLAVMAAVAEQVVITGTIAVLCLVVGGSFQFVTILGWQFRRSFHGRGWLYASSIIVVIAFADNHSACIISNSFELVAGDTAGLLLTIAL